MRQPEPLRGQLTIPATDEGTLDALRFAGELDDERVWAVEDCRHVSGRLERGLVASGDRVIRVAPGLTETSQASGAPAGEVRSDRRDRDRPRRAPRRHRHAAGRVPRRAGARDPGADRLPRPARSTSASASSTGCAGIWCRSPPSSKRRSGPQGLIGPRIRAKVARGLARLPRSPQVRVAKAILKRICEIYREEGELLAELKALIEAHCPQLLAERGCGTVTAAIIIGHTAGAKRFPTDACFARHAGTAPIPASSGNTKRHRLHRGGDRQLNRALHIIALSRARTDPATRAYLDRRHSEGKTKKEAIRCLKRHLARRIWRLLYTTQNRPTPHADQSLEYRKYRTSLDIGGAKAAP